MAEPFWMPFALGTGVGLRWGPDRHMLWVIFKGKDMSGDVRKLSALSCAKMAEPIEMPFGLWTRVAQGSMY